MRILTLKLDINFLSLYIKHLWNLKFHYHDHKNLPLNLILSQLIPVQIFTPYYSNIHFNILVKSTPTFPKCSFLEFSDKNFGSLFCFSHASYMSHKSLSWNISGALSPTAVFKKIILPHLPEVWHQKLWNCSVVSLVLPQQLRPAAQPELQIHQLFAKNREVSHVNLQNIILTSWKNTP